MAGVVQFRTKPWMGKKYTFSEKLQYYPYRVMERLGLVFVVSFQLYVVCIIPDNYVFIVVFFRPLSDFDSSPGIASLKSWKFKKHVGKRVMKGYPKFMDSDQVCDFL